MIVTKTSQVIFGVYLSDTGEKSSVCSWGSTIKWTNWDLKDMSGASFQIYWALKYYNIPWDWNVDYQSHSNFHEACSANGFYDDIMREKKRAAISNLWIYTFFQPHHSSPENRPGPPCPWFLSLSCAILLISSKPSPVQNKSRCLLNHTRCESRSQVYVLVSQQMTWVLDTFWSK